MELAEWDAERIVSFTLRYGPLSPKNLTGSDLEHFEPGDPVRIDTAQFVGLQKLLCDAWRGDPKALKEVVIGLTGDLELRLRLEGLEVAVLDLWVLIRLLFLRDHAKGKTKVCPNPDCPTPCFLRSRKGQKYCSHRCAVLISVWRFREREAERVQNSRRKSKRR